MNCANCKKEITHFFGIDLCTDCLNNPVASRVENQKCSVSYDAERKQINGDDKTDHFNEPAFYTQSKRGIEKAWQALVKDFKSEMGMYDVARYLSERKIKVHTWCRVD